MVATLGLVGFRPAPAHARLVTSPPYDVIKKGTALEKLLSAREESLFHVILGEDPKGAFERMVREGWLVPDEEPAYYVYEQSYSDALGSHVRTGVFVAAEVTPYEAKQVIRHEKTFDDKVKGRIALAQATKHNIGPVFALTKAPIAASLEEAKKGAPLYEFETDLAGLNDLHGIASRVFRVTQASEVGRALQAALAQEPLYIADGHHRYHAALLGGQTHALMYVTSEATIQAYDRVVRGTRAFADVRSALSLRPSPEGLITPPKHTFCLYDGRAAYLLDAREVPSDVVGGLDCSILERELYPALGLEHSMIADLKHFDYYPESQLDQMKAAVDRGEYDLAIALHPVSIGELMAVADAGLSNSDIVMPEKSTFFAPKILSGLFAYRHTLK